MHVSLDFSWEVARSAPVLYQPLASQNPLVPCTGSFVLSVLDWVDYIAKDKLGVRLKAEVLDLHTSTRD